MPYGLMNITAGVQAGKQQNVITLPTPDRAVIAREDSINDSQPGPLRYAYAVEVNPTLEIRCLKVKLPGAPLTNVPQDKFRVRKFINENDFVATNKTRFVKSWQSIFFDKPERLFFASV
jgi:hypothetical protein